MLNKNNMKQNKYALNVECSRLIVSLDEKIFK